jgi:hypothetical protein
MKTTVRDLMTAISNPGGLNKLASSSLPVKVAYKLSRLVDIAQSTGREIEEKRIEMIKTLGEYVKDAEGNDTQRLQVKAENEAEFTAAFDEILNAEKEIWYEPVTLDDIDAAKLSPNDILWMGPFIQAPEEVEDKKVVVMPKRQRVTM